MMSTVRYLLLVVLLLQANIWMMSALTKFTGLKCESLDKHFGDFTECKIKAVDRKTSHITISFKTNTIINDCRIHFKFMKKANGWKPFLYDMEIEACDFMLNPRRYPLPNIIYYYLRNYTNVNHTCPYKIGEALALASFEINEKSLLSQFPIDMGEYGLFTEWYIGNKLRVLVNGSASFSNYRKLN